MQTALAVDIGATKLAVGVVDTDGAVLVSNQRPTDQSFDGEGLYAALVELAGSVLKTYAAGGGSSAAPVVCGIGSGGPMTAGGELISPLNIVAWRDFPLRDRLAETFSLPCALDNDAKALALAEGWVGAAAGRSDFIAMVVSSGVGGGIVSGGALLDGRTGNAGHIGHIIVEPDGQLCMCGARGCLEAEASGMGIERWTGRPAAEADEALKRRTGTLVGRAVAAAATLVDLDLAVVAGSVALGFGEPFFAAAQAEIDARAGLDYARGTKIIPAGLGAEGPIVGAAAVGWRLHTATAETAG